MSLQRLQRVLEARYGQDGMEKLASQAGVEKSATALIKRLGTAGAQALAKQNPAQALQELRQVSPISVHEIGAALAKLRDTKRQAAVSRLLETASVSDELRNRNTIRGIVHRLRYGPGAKFSTTKYNENLISPTLSRIPSTLEQRGMLPGLEDLIKKYTAGSH